MPRWVFSRAAASPLFLFAVVADLLRKLQEVLANEGVALAFAGDVAVVLRSLRDFPRILAIFEKHEIPLDLKLNFPQTAAAPLFCPGKLEEATNVLLLAAPATALVSGQDRAEYLGALLGPGAGNEA
eukprot:845798-Alexandrium_andersonii.AAC.2